MGNRPMLQISEDAVQEAVDTEIQARIAEVLNDKPDEMIRQFVGKALAAETRYGRNTVFGKAVKEMIQKAAREEMSEWLEEKKPVMREVLREKLQEEEDNVLRMVADRIIDGMTDNFHVYVRWKDTDED